MAASQVRKYLVFALVWAAVVATWAHLPSLLIASRAPAGAWYPGGVQNTEDACFYISQLADGARGTWLLPNRMTAESGGRGEFRPFFTIAGMLGRGLDLSPASTWRVLNVLGAFLFALALAMLAGWMLGWSRWAAAAAVLATWAAGPVSMLPESWREPLQSLYGILAAEDAMSESNTWRAMAATGALFSFALLLQIGVLWSWARAAAGARRCLFALPVCVLALGFTHPYDLPPLSLAALIALALPGDRTLHPRLRSACLVVLAAAAPPFLYHAWLLRADPDVALYYQNIFLNSPNPYSYLLAVLPFALFVPWVLAGVAPERRTAARLLLFWIVAILVCLYLPVRIQRRMVEGLHWMAVLAGVAGAAALWRRRGEWNPNPAALAGTVLAGALLVLGLVPNLRYPFAVSAWAAQHPQDYFLYREERSALAYCAASLPPGRVVACSRSLGPFVAALTPHRAYLAHYHQTLNLRAKTETLGNILNPTTPELERQHILALSPITHLIFGPRERAITSWRPEAERMLVECYADPSGSVRVYAVQREELPAG